MECRTRMPRIVYSPHYNIGFLGLERLHPFDSRKYGRAWKCLQDHFGSRLAEWSVRPRRAANREDLLRVHTPGYLGQLRKRKYLARALEFPPVAALPWWVTDWAVLRPMRWATMGTIVAARKALDHGLAVNLGGGFHHAKPGGGEGFCIYSDIAIAVHTLRNEGLLSQSERVAYVDLDAHQGNGVCHAFLDDKSVFIFDMYNSTIYPAHDTEARERIDCDIRLTSNCHEREYLRDLENRLPGFLDSISRTAPLGLAIYNAGTDVFQGDPLGALNLSAAAILRRDLFTVQALRERRIPTVMLLSGGYARESYRLVADSVTALLENTQ